MSKVNSKNQVESEKLFPDEDFIVQVMEMPEPNLEAKGKKVTATISGKEKICLQCCMPLGSCNCDGNNNETN